MSRFAQTLEEEKVDLVQDVMKAKTKVRDLKRSEAAAVSDAEVAKAEVALLRAEVNAARRREAEVATSLGEVVRALAERIF